jgi:hypothetical protein
VQALRRSMLKIVDQKVCEGGCRKENGRAAQNGQDSHGRNTNRMVEGLVRDPRKGFRLAAVL